MSARGDSRAGDAPRSACTRASILSSFAACAWVQLVALCFCLSVAGCWSAGVRSIPDTRTRYDSLPPLGERRFREARREIDAGKLAEARISLQGLAEEYPDNVVVGVWLQELEIQSETDSAASTPAPGGASPMDELRARWRKAAEGTPSAAGFVLLARLEEDDELARKDLDRAAELDPRCAWVPYARAFLAARRSNWDEVRRATERAIELDPGLMPARWLESWMLARSGRVPEAIQALTTWIDKARNDPRIQPKLALEARLDLALLYVLDDDAGRARKMLAELGVITTDGTTSARARMVEAAADQAAGDPRAALQAAKAAEIAAPGELVPVVQQALLNELWLHDEAAADAAWTNVLALSRNSNDLSAMLEGVRARVRLERHRAARAAAAATAEPRP